MAVLRKFSQMKVKHHDNLISSADIIIIIVI